MAGITLKQIQDRGEMTHMPFLAPQQKDSRILFFCKADRPKIWKLYYEDKDGIHRVETGLSADSVECSPTAWQDEDGWHVSFIGGNAPENRRYYLYRMDRQTLADFAPAIKVIKTGAGFIYLNRLVYTREGAVFIDDNEREIRTIDFPHHRIYRVSYQPDHIEKLIITAHDIQKNKIYVIEHDLKTNDETKIECDGKTAYKCALLGTEIVYADRFGVGFEDRKIKTGVTVTHQFLHKLIPDKIERKQDIDPIGKNRFEICKSCNQSTETGFGCVHHKRCCFGLWRSQPENKCLEGKW